MTTLASQGVVDEALWMDVADVSILGVVSLPNRADMKRDIGVLICVGGSQYRVGSHRQFVTLARRLAAGGYPTLRFDYRGKGDSDGTPRSFTEVGPEIDAAILGLRSSAGVSQVVLWGLCDAASAVLIHMQKTDSVCGLVLVNPWVRNDATLAVAQLKHYYTARLWSSEFWRKLVSGQVRLRDSMSSFIRSARTALLRSRYGRQDNDGPAPPYQAQMAAGLRGFSGPVLLAISGNDLTAKEFLDHARCDPAWTGLIEKVKRAELPDADHTFSSADSRYWLEDQTLRWLDRFPGALSPALHSRDEKANEHR